MSSLDRLSALMERFELKVSPTSFEQANFVIVHCKDNEWPKWLYLTPKGHKLDPVCDATDVSFSAHVSWGGDSNPFFSALNELVKLEIDGDSDIRPLIELLLTEYNSPRCGSSSVLSRLSEILVVGLLRKQIQQGATSISLLGGLADKRLSRAIGRQLPSGTRQSLAQRYRSASLERPQPVRIGMQTMSPQAKMRNQLRSASL